MKPYSYKFLAAFVLTASGLMLTGCQQPAASTATPAPTTTVVEEVHHGDDRDRDRDHPRPDDNARRDHPEGQPGH
jgi:hypothetical protein